MEESKELQGFYKIFRAVIYISVLMEFFEYAIDPRTIDGFGGVVCDLHDRIKQWFIYHDGNLVYSKVVTFLLVCITCVGTRNKKHLEFDARRQVLYPLVSGVGLLIVSVWLFGYAMDTRLYALRLNIILYMVATIIGTVLVHVALDNISKFLKEGLMKDRFNFENESFEQCQKEEYNKYSVNIPMRYYYKGKFRKGWVNIVNPFRGTWVVGTPGSGKTFSIIEPFIRQHSAKGFAMVVYDYKFPTLATKLYYHYKKNQQLGKLPEGCKFNIINFVDVEYSKRVNPIQQKYINNLAAASETAETLLESLQKGKKEGGGGSDQFFQTSAVNFLAACIYFFINYGKEPYDKDGKMLIAEKVLDPKTMQMKPTGKVFNHAGEEVEPAYWLGKYSDMPHILSFLNESYQTIFNVLETDNEVARLQMEHFYEKTGSEWQEPNSYEKLFRVIDGVMGTYSCGTQADMNMAAWRSVMPVDYLLIEAYKQLADLCNGIETTKLIHDDYMYTLTTYRAHRESIDEWYSDLPREQGTLFEWLLRSKLENINLLIKNYKRGKIDNNTVKKNLQEHLCLANKRLVKLTKDFLDRERDDFR